MKTLFSPIYWRIRAKLPLLSPRRVAHYARSKLFDVWHGLDTSAIVSAAQLQGVGENGIHAVRYQPSPFGFLQYCMTEMGLDFKNYVFVDFGSGKGRILLEAASYPFKAIIGVEFSPTLHDQARLAVDRWTSRRHGQSPIHLECCDAATFEIPKEDLVLYFYNPFGAPVMEAVIRNIERSLQMFDRDVYILYLNPQCAPVIEGCSQLHLVNSSRYGGSEFRIYRSGQRTSQAIHQ